MGNLHHSLTRIRAPKGIGRIKDNVIEPISRIRVRRLEFNTGETGSKRPEVLDGPLTLIGQRQIEIAAPKRIRSEGGHRHNQDFDHMICRIPASGQRVLVPIVYQVVSWSLGGLEPSFISIDNARPEPRAPKRVHGSRVLNPQVRAEGVWCSRCDDRQRIHKYGDRVPRVTGTNSILQQVVVATRREDLRTDQARLTVEQGARSLPVHARPAHP